MTTHRSLIAVTGAGRLATVRGNVREQWLGVAIGLVALVAAAFAPGARAATITPTVTTDDLTNNGNCTLREAVQAASGNGTVDQCEAGDATAPDEILLTQPLYDLTLSGANEDSNLTGDLDVFLGVASPLTIIGDDGESTIDGGNADRVIDVKTTTGSSLTLAHVRLDHGHPPSGGNGGALRVPGLLNSVILNSSRVTNSTTAGVGGGMQVTGDLTLNDSTVSGNVSTAPTGLVGGGIRATKGVTINAELDHEQQRHRPRRRQHRRCLRGRHRRQRRERQRDRFDDREQHGHRARQLGRRSRGRDLRRGRAAANRAQHPRQQHGERGERAELRGRRRLHRPGDYRRDVRRPELHPDGQPRPDRRGRSSDPWGDHRDPQLHLHPELGGPGGRSIFYDTAGVAGTSLAVGATILSENGTSECSTNGSIASAGFNIDRGTSCGLTGTGDLQSTNPGLLGEADNGGPTVTHALPGGSPALDRIPAASCNGVDGTPLGTDQRGAPRGFDEDGDSLPECDVGAYELNRCQGKIVDRLVSHGFTGTAAPHVILGSDSGNLIDLRQGNDTVCAGGGDDAVIERPDGGSDALDGGPGFDTLLLGIAPPTSPAGTIDLASGTASSTGMSASLSSFENAAGSPADDTLIGDAGPNRLDGQSGADTIDGGAGPDTLLGGNDDDQLFARDGIADTVDCGAGAADSAQTDQLSLDSVSGCESVDAIPELTVEPPLGGAPGASTQTASTQTASTKTRAKCKKKKKKHRRHAAAAKKKKCKKKKRRK